LHPAAKRNAAVLTGLAEKKIEKWINLPQEPAVVRLLFFLNGLFYFK
jgi:hypothetical protein